MCVSPCHKTVGSAGARAVSQGLWVLASGSGEASVTAGGVRCLQRHVQGPGLQGKSHPQGSQSLSGGLSQQGQCHLLGQPPRRAAHTHLPPERGDSPQILDLSYTGVTPPACPSSAEGHGAGWGWRGVTSTLSQLFVSS